MELNAIAVSTPGFDPLFTACLNEAREVVPSLRMMTDSNLLLGWVGDSFANVKGVPAVIDATASWRECMTKAGYAETPNSPFEMVTSLDNFGIPPMYESGADGAPLSPLTQAEIMLAVADATCQESSGWTQAIYDTQWDAQVKVLSEHADELVRMRDQWDKDREVLLRIIAENAPAK